MTNTRMRFTGGAIGLVLAAGGVAAAPAGAAQSTLPLDCGGQQLLVRTNDNHSSEHGGWGVGVVVDGGSGHLIPTSFSGSLYDVTTGTALFSFDQAKAGGQANPRQQTVTCTSVQQDTLGDFLGSGAPLPPDTNAGDQVTFTLTVTAVPKL